MLFYYISKNVGSVIMSHTPTFIVEPHFSKIRKNKDYTPKKTIVFSFAIALELSVSDTERLLESAGYSLSNSYELDIAIGFFLQKRYYDRHRINELLYQYGIETL